MKSKLKEYMNTSGCVKCGSANASTRYYNHIKFMDSLFFDVIFRKCEDCGYEWLETPLDYVKGE